MKNIHARNILLIGGLLTLATSTVAAERIDYVSEDGNVIDYINTGFAGEDRPVDEEYKTSIYNYVTSAKLMPSNYELNGEIEYGEMYSSKVIVPIKKIDDNQELLADSVPMNVKIMKNGEQVVWSGASFQDLPNPEKYGELNINNEYLLSHLYSLSSYDGKPYIYDTEEIIDIQVEDMTCVVTITDIQENDPTIMVNILYKDNENIVRTVSRLVISNPELDTAVLETISQEYMPKNYNLISVNYDSGIITVYVKKDNPISNSTSEKNTPIIIINTATK